MLKIEKMYAFIAQNGDGEGICAEFIGSQWMPLVGGDLSKIERLKPLAQEIANHTGNDIKLVYFSERTEIEVIKPK